MYYRIASENASVYEQRDSEYSQLQNCAVGETESSARMERCYEEREQAAVVAVTFAGMALEAFFYDYASEQLGDSFVESHLDKLDLKSKFLVYPRLIVGKMPDKSRSAYQKLVSLVKLRNMLVHFKSKAFPVGQLDKASNFHDELNESLREGVCNAITCVMQVMAELDQLHGAGAGFAVRMHWGLS